MREEIRLYIASLKEAAAVSDYRFPTGTSREEFTDIRRKQRDACLKLRAANDAFLAEYLPPLAAKDRLNDAEKAELEEFARGLSVGVPIQDDGILLQIYTILYRNAMQGSDLNEQVKYVYHRAFREYAVTRLSADYRKFRGFEEIRDYADLYGLLNKEGKSYFMRCWCNQLLHIGYSWQERQEILDFVREKEAEEPEAGLPYGAYYMAMYRNIKNLLNDVIRNDSDGKPTDEGCLTLAEEATDYVCEHLSQMKNSPRANRMIALLSYHCARFHSGKIGLEELLREIDKLCVIGEDYNILEKATVYFRLTTAAYNYRFSYDPDFNTNDAYRVLRTNLEEATKFMRSLKSSEIDYSMAIEYWTYLNSLMEHLHYDQLKPYFADALRSLDPDLYVHSLYTGNIAVLLGEAILEEDPGYFCGVPGLNAAEDVAGSRHGINGILYNQGLLHDIGLFRLLGEVNTLHRSLTPAERQVCESHRHIGTVLDGHKHLPPEVEDGIRFHGDPYIAPSEAHPGKPFTDILHFADEMEKRTSPLFPGGGEVLSPEAFLAAAEKLSGSEFAPKVVEAALKPAVKAKLLALLGEERLDSLWKCHVEDA